MRFVWLSADQIRAYRAEWRAIDRRFPHFDPPPDGVSLADHWAMLEDLRVAARAELREATLHAARELAEHGLEAKFPIAI